MNNPVNIIVAREYLERVKRKSFIISTLLMPLLMAALMFLPILIEKFSGGTEAVIAVIDDTGKLSSALKNTDDIKFVNAVGEMSELKANEDYTAILAIGSDAVSTPNRSISFFTHGAPSAEVELLIHSQLKDAIRSERIKSYGIDNLQQILREIEPEVNISTYRIDEAGDQSTSSGLSMILAIITTFVLYMFILMYGQMVMTSIIEEKNNRVLEIVVSSVKPFYLMAGKIIGVGLVALTQLLIWGVLLLICSAWVVPVVLGSMAHADAEMLAAFGQLGDVAFMAHILVLMIVFLIGGYLFYSAIFAAIGSAVDNIQDASQLTSVTIVPIILAITVSMGVLGKPDSALAVWCSFIPFTSPMVMMARVPFGVPLLQEIGSVAILFACVAGMIWFAGKVYRVGIFMYGKKPTVREIIKWTRYK